MGYCEREKLATILSFGEFCREGESPRYPLEIFLELSNVCDLKCAMCPEFSALNPHRFSQLRLGQRGFLERDTFGTNLNRVLSGALLVNCFGYGEATIHPDFRDFIALVGSYESMTAFTTNGMHIDEDMARFLVDQNVFRVTFSFSGLTKAEYESVYIGGVYETVLGGIQRLAAEKRRRGRNYPLIEINSIGFRHHVATFDRFVEMMGDAGANVVHLKVLVSHDQIPELHDHISLPGPAELETVGRAEEIGRKLGVVVSAEQYIQSRSSERRDPAAPAGTPIEALAKIVKPQHRSERIEQRVISVDLNADEQAAMTALSIQRFPGLDREPFYCMEPFKTMYVRQNGTVKPCCFAADLSSASSDDANSASQARTLPQTNVGSTGSNDAMDIWAGAGYRAIRSGIRSGSYPSICTHCLRERAAPADHHAADLVEHFLAWYTESHGPDLESRWEAECPEIHTLLRRPGAEIVTQPYRPAHKTLQRPNGLQRRGHLDGVRQGRALGWVWVPESPAVRLDVIVRERCTGKEIGTGRACRSRPDLAEHGIGDGCYGFSVVLPKGRSWEASDVVVSYRDGSERLLWPEHGLSDISWWPPGMQGMIGKALSLFGKLQEKRRSAK